jgi:hypothetical protein
MNIEVQLNIYSNILLLNVKNVVVNLIWKQNKNL